MPEPTTSAGDAAPPVTDDQAIRQRVKGLTSQVLQQGRVDPEAVREVVRAVIGRTPGNAAVSGAEARELFADAVRGLDEALVKSASATHGALQQLASRGRDFTDNDLKETPVSKLVRFGDIGQSRHTAVGAAVSQGIGLETV